MSNTYNKWRITVEGTAAGPHVSLVLESLSKGKEAAIESAELADRLDARLSDQRFMEWHMREMWNYHVEPYLDAKYKTSVRLKGYRGDHSVAASENGIISIVVPDFQDDKVGMKLVEVEESLVEHWFRKREELDKLQVEFLSYTLELESELSDSTPVSISGIICPEVLGSCWHNVITNEAFKLLGEHAPELTEEETEKVYELLYDFDREKGVLDKWSDEELFARLNGRDDLCVRLGEKYFLYLKGHTKSINLQHMIERLRRNEAGPGGVARA